MKDSQKEDYSDLISDCLQGSRRAQKRLFERFYSPMYRICMRYAGSTDEADDMISEGFLKVFSNLAMYENTGSFEAWMKQVVIHTALDYRRKYDPKMEMTELSEVPDLEMGYDVNPALSKISSEEIVSLIQRLPPTTRTVFNLFVFEGFSHAEIADQLQMAESTSAWHVNQARGRLKMEIDILNNER